MELGPIGIASAQLLDPLELLLVPREGLMEALCAAGEFQQYRPGTARQVSLFRLNLVQQITPRLLVHHGSFPLVVEGTTNPLHGYAKRHIDYWTWRSRGILLDYFVYNR